MSNRNILGFGRGQDFSARAIGISGTANSPTQAHTGSQSIESSNGTVNDILQIVKSSNFILTDYNLLNIWIYVTSNWAADDSISIYGWDTGTGAMVGNSVNLEDYFSWNVFGTWHKITIPLSDMGITGETIDAIRIEIITKSGAKSPTFYMDDMQFTGTNEEPGSGEFAIEPELGTWLHVHEFSYTIADDDYDSTLANATLPKIPYNTFLGVGALSAGILYQRVINEEVQFSVTVKQLSDVLQLAGAEITAQGSAGATGTWLTIKNEILEPIVLKSENKDKLRFIVNDNFSGLDLFRISAACRIEQRE